MKSIKPGRGPSMMNGIVGIFVALFGVFWTIMAFQMGAGFMSVFGIGFVAIAIVQVIYNFKNAAGENRYSEYDIVDEDEEKDPLTQKFGRQKKEEDFSDKNVDKGSSRYCPYCGTAVENDFLYCKHCGKKLP